MARCLVPTKSLGTQPRVGRLWVALGLALSGAVAFTGPVLSSDEAASGLTLLASHAPGGGYDAYARLYGRHLGKHFTGNPPVTVRNMPGAAGVVMANHLAAQALRNGSVIALGPGSLATAALFGSQGARYDARALTWIGSLNNDVSAVVSRSDAPVTSLEGLFSKELIVGGAGASDNSVVYATVLSRLFGAKLKLVAGYNGSGATVLALERGEVQGIAGWNYSSIVTMKPDWIRDGRINVLLQMSLSRHPDLPQTPAVIELARDEGQREILRLILAQSEIGRVVFAPPGLPAMQSEAHRSAFGRVIKDPEFLADAEKLRLEINQPLPGVDVEKLVADLHRASVSRVKDAVAALGGS